MVERDNVWRYGHAELGQQENDDVKREEKNANTQLGRQAMICG
jgi:hypothetical protein